MRRVLPPAAMALLAAACGGDGSAPEAEPAPAAVPAAPPARRDPFPAAAPPRDREFPPEPEFRRTDREAMVERQLKAIGVTDARVLDAMGKVPRHLFVPKEFIESAYDDTPLPIGHEQTISAPDIVGYMSQALGVGEGDRVLEVGTGSGYQAAVLAEMGCRVFTIEIVPPLAASAETRLRDLGYTRATVRCGDGYAGWPEEAPFDGILVAAAPEHVPQPLVDQLRPGARLVLPVGPRGETQRMVILTRRPDGTVDRQETLAVRFVPLTGRGGTEKGK